VRCFVFRPDIAAIDRQHAFVINADENAGAGDVGGIVDRRPRFEGGQRRLDFPEPLIDLVRQFVGFAIVGLQLARFGFERIDCRAVLIGQVGWQPIQFAHALGVSIGEIHTAIHFQPSAAMVSASAFSLSVTRRSSSGTSRSQPPSSCSNRSRMTMPPACS
jgi:hypothetical protein